MNNFHFSKIIAGVWPTLAKETVLSKVINFVDVFRMSLSGWFDDNNKKYIDTLMKLDNSKTILLETKWTDIRVKNVMDVSVRKWSTIALDYSEYAQESDKRIFIDYPDIQDLPTWTKIYFQQSDILIKVKSIKDDYIMCEVLQWWKVLQYDRVDFGAYEIDTPFFTEKDKKDILWWLEYWVHMIAPSNVKTRDDVMQIKDYLTQQNAEKMKVISKIENSQALNNIDQIADISDWIILVYDKISSAMTKKKISLDSIIKKIRSSGKPVIINFIANFGTNKYPLTDEAYIKKLCYRGVDGFMLDIMIKEEDPLNIITQMSDILDKYELRLQPRELERFDENEESMVRDYIIFNACRIIKEVWVRAIVCFTENWYTASRLASLNPTVPVITFTKSDETYRYLNSLRWSRGYKISQSFNYENLKRIWKEMIRIIFKWNISLDDKILIVQANEFQKDSKSDMINWVELYKFKNI
jgi:pyruvate kinase